VLRADNLATFKCPDCQEIPFGPVQGLLYGTYLYFFYLYFIRDCSQLETGTVLSGTRKVLSVVMEGLCERKIGSKALPSGVHREIFVSILQQGEAESLVSAVCCCLCYRPVEHRISDRCKWQDENMFPRKNSWTTCLSKLHVDCCGVELWSPR
jgi:hypothetical protein